MVRRIVPSEDFQVTRSTITSAAIRQVREAIVTVHKGSADIVVRRGVKRTSIACVSVSIQKSLRALAAHLLAISSVTVLFLEHPIVGSLITTSQ